MVIGDALLQLPLRLSLLCGYVLQLFISMPLCSHAKVPKVVLRVGRRCCLALSKDSPSLPHDLWFCGLEVDRAQRKKFLVLQATMRDPAMQTIIVGEDISNGIHQLPYGALFVEAHTEEAL